MILSWIFPLKFLNLGVHAKNEVSYLGEKKYQEVPW